MRARLWLTSIGFGFSLVLLALLVMVWLTLAEATRSLNETTRSLNEVQDAVRVQLRAKSHGEEYMMAQPCRAVMTEYELGREADWSHASSVLRVSNMYNEQTGGEPRIISGDAELKVQQCLEDEHKWR